MVEVNKAYIYISGYEWGPGVSKVIVSLSHPVENVKKDSDTIFSSKKDRKIIDIYLSNSKGYRVSENSSYVTLELETYYDQDGSISPFSFNIPKLQNEWIDKYVIKASFHVKHDGKDSLLKIDQDCINNRICEDTDQFNVRGTFSERYQNPKTKEEVLLTLHYAAYEPKELKGDKVKHPLIVWLNGQGEGGTDVEIALLGNKVTALAKPEIQKYFTSENGENGSYVLLVQCPTYWMDGGESDVYCKGDVESIYTNVLMNTINAYLTKNNDVDTNRIYIGGCSNGGYMTMNMVIKYPDMWAASYQTCTAYMFMVGKRDESGQYIIEEGAISPNQVVQTDVRWFSEEKINIVKNIPLWIVHSATDKLVIPWRYAFPAYQELLKAGAKNAWFSYFENVEGIDDKGVEYDGHWSWICLFNDQVSTVQDREKILHSTDMKYFGMVPCNQGGGCEKAKDEKGTYSSLFAWLNSQVKHH